MLLEEFINIIDIYLFILILCEHMANQSKIQTFVQVSNITVVTFFKNNNLIWLIL